MAILYDQHMHSAYSGDAKDSMEDMIKSAIAKGLSGITFTEHQDLEFPYEENGIDEGRFNVNTDAYLYDLLSLRSKYQDKIHVGFGIELGLQAEAVRPNAIYAKSHEFDMIIASLHIVDRMDPYYPAYHEGKTEEEAYGLYFKRFYENLLRFENFDVLGHLDYIIRYGANMDKNYKYEIYKDTIDKILEYLIEHEKALEINTAGIRKGTRDVHPTVDILKTYKSMGGDLITVGSDAHNMNDIAADFNRAEEALRDCGFKYYCVYENRIAEYKKLV